MTLPARIAIIGANGFVGSRLVESLHLRNAAIVVPVVRRATGLARASRFELEWKLADSRSEDALAPALAGCQAAVDAAVGDPPAIEAAARALIPAARRAGVRRVIYLSSASVHGQNPAPGCNEDTPLSDRQDIAYNNAKVRAERRLFADASRLGVELVILRPAVVFGPRDRWVSVIVRELMQGTAWLLRDGTGLCNTLYVDNLVHAIERALVAPAAATGAAYLLNDAETPTWAELHDRLRQLLPGPLPPLHSIPLPPDPRRGWRDRLDALRASATAQAFIARVPAALKDAAKGALAGLNAPAKPNPWQLPAPAGPRSSLERVRLQQCVWRFPDTKARDVLGFAPPVSLQAGLERTVAWLRWCGHLPVGDPCKRHD